jgi:acyltransferase
MNKRITWIDTTRGINIFLVVLGHTILPYAWQVYVFSFHMPLFFFLSGYLFNPKKYPDFWQFIIKKARSLLIPYLFFCLLAYIYWVFRFGSTQFFDPIWQAIMSANWLYPPFIPLWFLTTLFVVEIYFYLLQKYLPKLFLPIAIVLSTALGFWLGLNNHLMIWGADIALVASLFYYLGFLAKQNNNWIKSWAKKFIWIIVPILFIANYLLSQIHNYQMSMLKRAYDVPLVFILAGLTGIGAYLLLSKILKQTIFKEITIFDFLGQNSLIILGLHTIVYYFVTDFFKFQLGLDPRDSVLFALLYTILTILLICPFIYIINKKIPFVIGKNNLIVKQN